MHSAFNLLIFPNSIFTPFFLFERAMCSLDKWYIEITTVIIIIIIISYSSQFLTKQEQIQL